LQEAYHFVLLTTKCTLLPLNYRKTKGSAIWRGPARKLRRGDAVEIEAEKEVGLESRQTWAWGQWAPWEGLVRASKTLFVDANVHGLDGAEAGIHEEGDGHGVEEGRCFLPPLMVTEERERR